jgi:protein-L-isoaspartate O-methyltransferase
MLRVDRGNYAPNFAYDDSPQYLGFEQTISAPHMHAHALELLKDKLVPGAVVRVLFLFLFFLVFFLPFIRGVCEN